MVLERGLAPDGSKKFSQTVNLVEQAHCLTARIEIVRPDNAGPTWLDDYVNLAKSYVSVGIRPYILAGLGATLIKYDPLNSLSYLPHYIDSLKRIVSEFGPYTNLIELINEPNRPAQTVRLVTAQNMAAFNSEVYDQVIKKQGLEDKITLISGPLHSHDLTNGANIPADSGALYLDAFYRAGIQSGWGNEKPFGQIGYHIYVAQGTTDANKVTQGINNNLDAIGQVIGKYDPGKYLSLSEVGWGTGPGRVNEQGQGQNLFVAYHVLRQHPHVARWLCFTLRDFDTRLWGLTHSDGTPKPAFPVFAALPNN